MVGNGILWRIRYRLQLGQQWLAYVNFGLLLVTVAKMFGLSALYALAVIPIGFIGMYLWGWFLDAVAKQQHNDELEYLKRSPAWKVHMENHHMLKEISRRLL